MSQENSVSWNREIYKKMGFPFTYWVSICPEHPTTRLLLRTWILVSTFPVNLPVHGTVMYVRFVMITSKFLVLLAASDERGSDAILLRVKWQRAGTQILDRPSSSERIAMPSLRLSGWESSKNTCAMRLFDKHKFQTRHQCPPRIWELSAWSYQRFGEGWIQDSHSLSSKLASDCDCKLQPKFVC